LRGSHRQQHRSWPYLEAWLGRAASCTGTGGVPPSSSYLAPVLEVLKKQPVKMIIHAA
jgi:hypothetical protein